MCFQFVPPSLTHLHPRPSPPLTGPQTELDQIDTFAALLPLLPPNCTLRLHMVGPDVPEHLHGDVLVYDEYQLSCSPSATKLPVAASPTAENWVVSSEASGRGGPDGGSMQLGQGREGGGPSGRGVAGADVGGWATEIEQGGVDGVGGSGSVVARSGRHVAGSFAVTSGARLEVMFHSCLLHDLERTQGLLEHHEPAGKVVGVGGWLERGGGAGNDSRGDVDTRGRWKSGGEGEIESSYPLPKAASVPAAAASSRVAPGAGAPGAGAGPETRSSAQPAATEVAVSTAASTAAPCSPPPAPCAVQCRSEGSGATYEGGGDHVGTMQRPGCGPELPQAPLLVFAPNAGLPVYLSWLPSLELLLGRRGAEGVPAQVVSSPTAGGTWGEGPAEEYEGSRESEGAVVGGGGRRDEGEGPQSDVALRGGGDPQSGSRRGGQERRVPMACVFTAYNEEECVRSVALLEELYGLQLDVQPAVNPFRQPLWCVERVGNGLPSYSNGFMYGWFGVR